MEYEAWIRECITTFIASSPENSLHRIDAEPAFGQPFIGFSKGDDPLYDFFKKDIGRFYHLPNEIFSAAFPEKKVIPAQLSVICWILPQTEATRKDHRLQTTYPSERWTRVRQFGEEFNNHVRKAVVNVLHEKGYRAVAPALSPLWERKHALSNR